MSFGEILVKKNFITNDLLIQAKERAAKSGVSLEEILLENNVSETAVLEAKSEAFGIPIRRLSLSAHIAFDVLKNIPEESVRHYKFAPLGMREGVMEIGIVNPDDMEAREALQFLSSKLNLPLKIFLIAGSDLNNVLKDYKSLGGETSNLLDELESIIAEKSTSDEVKKEQSDAGGQIIEEAPITKMVAVILRHAIDGNASDVHIEPLVNKLKVRFRVDGVLHTSLILPIQVHGAVVGRIKILTNLKLDEKRKPQDGRFEATVGGRRIDFRVSTLPTFLGEKVVIRVLDATQGLRKLEEVGLIGRNLEIVKEALKRPYGLILLTGPTGSGKTTTLYSMLSLLDREKYNVVSLEDPIEYNVEGVSQSQVHPEIDYTFANGLRSILRQDPDMIMVGEIRDKETAVLAIQAALTGHLVFSTLHTNNAIGVIPRLIDMGVDPFLIPATLTLAIGQRLVRKLCPESRKEMPVSEGIKKFLDKEMEGVLPERRGEFKMPQQIYQSLPSGVCPRGTRGRVGVFEVLQMTQELEQIILTSPSESAIMKEAINQGMTTMRQDGILKVFKGEIGMEELKEVI